MKGRILSAPRPHSPPRPPPAEQSPQDFSIVKELSEIETAARDDIAVSFGYIAGVYGFPDADLEKLVATRDWLMVLLAKPRRILPMILRWSLRFP